MGYSDIGDGIGAALIAGLVGTIAAVVFSWWVSLWIAIPLTALVAALPCLVAGSLLQDWWLDRRDRKAREGTDG